MNSDFTVRCLLGDIALGAKLGIVDGPFGSNLPGTAYTEKGIPVIRGSNLTKGKERFRDSGFVFVSAEMAVKLSRSTCIPGDIILTKKGTLGQVGIIPTRSRYPIYLLSSNQMRLRVDPQLADPSFVYYFLAQPDSVEKITRESEHTGVPKINLGYLRNFSIRLPPLAEQKKISEFLQVIDDRIALLRETNVKLEAIAQALFKSWFVDFEPVRAKQEGRVPEGMDEALAALFPADFEESELGAVPRGWRVSPIGDVVDYAGGGTPSTKEPKFWEPGEFAWTTPKDLSGLESAALLRTERQLSEKGLAKISSGLLPAGTLLLSSRAPIGYLAVAQIPLAINQGYIAMLPSSQLPPLYLLYWCRNNMEVIKSRANGSTFMEISKRAFRPIPAIVPPEPVLMAFTDVAGALFDRLVENAKQAQTLSTLRDALLPRLISGQLRLPEVKEEIAEALSGT